MHVCTLSSAAPSSMPLFTSSVNWRGSTKLALRATPSAPAAIQYNGELLRVQGTGAVLSHADG
jgi:hypothetical protein